MVTLPVTRKTIDHKDEVGNGLKHSQTPQLSEFTQQTINSRPNQETTNRNPANNSERSTKVALKHVGLGENGVRLELGGEEARPFVEREREKKWKFRVRDKYIR
ncbi:hypothetical protein C2S51_037966 [Perilla frutescens var. frutescens]|nr:hypothetical protein C2S51_037966 [Perilla frutescens var. frutescens]